MAKRQKLDYNLDELTENLKQSAGQGVDAFFPSHSPTNQPKEKESSEKKTPNKNVSNGNASPTPSSTTPPNQTQENQESENPSIDIPQDKMVQANRDVTKSRSHDVMTSVFQDINTKLWREIIEETETHNSSLRMSARERDQVEDVVRVLKRKYKIKTSMNEIARLGLLFLIHDFKKRGAQSIITDVKTS